jgi:hypothetical protein
VAYPVPRPKEIKINSKKLELAPGFVPPQVAAAAKVEAAKPPPPAPAPAPEPAPPIVPPDAIVEAVDINKFAALKAPKKEEAVHPMVCILFTIRDLSLTVITLDCQCP